MTIATAVPPRWKHQQDALDFIRGKPGAMLAYDMGTGKTRVVVDKVREHRHRTVIILAPKSACAVWPREFRKYFDPELWTGEGILVLNGRQSTKAKVEMARTFMDARDCARRGAILVMNYETAWRPPMHDYLLGRRWDLFVMDESHKIKAPGGRASKFCATLRDRCKHRLALTGTPMPHSPLDLYAQYRALDPDIFGRSFARYKMMYALWGGYNGYEVLRWINQDDLAARMYSIALRVESQDVLDLPEYTDDDVDIELGPAARQAYRELEALFLAQVEDGTVTVSNVLTKLLRLSQVANGYAKLDSGEEVAVGSEKQDALLELLESMGNEPVVVFCRYHHDLDAVRDSCTKLGRQYRELSGRVSQWEAWQYDKDGDVLAVQLQAGGAGIDLTRSRYCIFYSLSYSLGDYDQCRRRVHRPGQTRSTHYYHLIARDSVDEVIRQALADRREIVDAVMDWAKHKKEGAE